MKNLIPNFIQQRFNETVFEGNFSAFSMFIDISGFTNMTETLMKQGEEGAEILSDILNKIFNPVVDSIYERGGFISTFAGDAFTAIFPKDIVQHSVHPLICAQIIQNIFAEHGHQQTKFGNFHLKVKVGLSAGNVDWGIVGKDKKAYYFSGEAVDGCAQSEHHAEKGDIIFDKEFLSKIPESEIRYKKKKSGYFCLNEISQFDELTKQKVDLPEREPLSEGVLSQFFPKSVITFAQRGEFRNVVPIFISFESIKSKQVLDDFISIFIEDAYQFGGYFNKFDSGDKGNVAIIVFGAPTAYEDNLQRALNFVLNVRKELLADDELRKIRYRIGMTYGKVYAGIVGGDKRCEYTVLGDIVNLAARFMMKAEFNQIWVSGNIFKLAQNDYQLESLGEFEFKGKTGKINAYQLLGKKQVARDVFTGKFVGRSQEMKAVGTHFDTLKRQKMAGVVYIYGRAGVGKSRFVYELREKYKEFDWHYLPCDSVLKKSFNPFTYFLSNFFLQLPENSREENKANFDRIYDSLAKAQRREEGKTLAPLREAKTELIRLKSIIEGFLGIHDIAEDSLYNQLDTKLRYENTIYAFKEIFKALSIINPIIIELEDLHWIDSDSLNAFQNICRNIEDFPILIIVTSRYYDDESKPTLNVDVNQKEIDLNVLSEEGTVELSESILEGKISQKLKTNLSEKTVGNPFFIEQTVYYYRETGIIVFDEEKEIWELQKEERKIPDTVNDLLIARVDRLSAKLKEAVQAASVFGSEFEIKLLLEVLRNMSTTWSEQDFEQFIHEGEASKVWSILSEIKGIFAHAMMRDAVYNMQLKARLRDLHKLIAEILEKFFPDDKKVYEDLAFHYERAEIKDKTMEYLLKAGDVAKDNFQNQKALELYEKLDGYYKRELGVEDDVEKVEVTDENRELIGEYVDLLVLKESHVLGLLGEKKKESEVAQKGLKLSKSLDDKNRIGVSLNQVGYILLNKGDYNKAKNYFQEALNKFQDLNNQKFIGVCFFNLGKIFWFTGEHEKALENFERNLKICNELENERRIADALGSIGVVYDYSGNFEKAMEYYEQQLKIYEGINYKIGIAQTLGNIGVAYYCDKNYKKSLEYYQKKLKLSQELGNKKEIAITIGNIGITYYETNEFLEAMKFLQKNLALRIELEDKAGIANALVNIANTYKSQNNYEEAIETYNKGLDLVKKQGIKNLLPEYLIEKADLYFLQHKFSEAKILNDEGLKIAERIGYKEYITKGKKLANKIQLIQDENFE